MEGFSIIKPQAAIEFLNSVRPGRALTWNGSEFQQGSKVHVTRHSRGGGSSVEYVSYGLFSPGGKLVAVARIAPAPYMNRPAVAAVGEKLAFNTVYLSRQCAVGIDSETLVEFIKEYTSRLRQDLLTHNPARRKRGKSDLDARYLLSLDDPYARVIEGPSGGVLAQSNAATGKVYVKAGALDAGMTNSQQRPTRYIGDDGQLHSIYQNGKNMLPELRLQGARLVNEGQKRRFIFILAVPGTLEYSAWRRTLPAWVHEAVWGENDLGVTQPRLLFRLLGLQPA
jgi:hypothetical protein